MAYQTGDTILDDEYNVFATGLAAGGSTDSANLNNVWGTGQADRGYGQSTILSAVTAGSTVTATQWATLLARITSAADHQGSSITAMSSPSATDIIEIIDIVNSSNISFSRKNLFSRYARRQKIINIQARRQLKFIEKIPVTFPSLLIEYFRSLNEETCFSPIAFGESNCFFLKSLIIFPGALAISEIKIALLPVNTDGKSP